MRRRLGPALVAVALVVASPLGACGDDDATSPSTTGSGRAPTTLATDTTASTATTGPTGAGVGGSSGSGGAPAGSSGATTTTANRPLAPGGVGDLAAALLQPGNGGRIVVEVRAQPGAEPRTATLDHLVSVLRQASGKTVVVDGIDPLTDGTREWTAGSITRTADAASTHAQGGVQVVLRLLFVHGRFDGDDSVLGVSVRGDVAAVFTDQVDSAAGLFTSTAVVEDAVVVHETGHLLGLVDLAIDTGRDDPDHPGHSTNQGSVMYWAVESGLIGQVLGGGVPTDFDAEDRADLARIRSA